MNVISNKKESEKKILKKNKKKRAIIFIGVLIVMVFSGLLFKVTVKNKGHKLKYSSGNISIISIKNDIDIQKGRNYDLQYISVDNIINHSDINIIRGIVKKIENIKVKIGEKEDFRAIVEIDVKEVIKGNLNNKKNIKVLVPIKSTIATFSDEIQTGIEGIFMPVTYDESGDKYFIKSGKNKLVLKDLADYGLLNGVYWLFLEKNGQCLFDRDKFDEIKDVKNLDKIEEYIKKRIKK